MNLAFQTVELAQRCLSIQLLVYHFGFDDATKFRQRLDDLAAARTLADLSAPMPGQFTLINASQKIFSATISAETQLFFQTDTTDDWTRIDCATILESPTPSTVQEKFDYSPDYMSPPGSTLRELVNDQNVRNEDLFVIMDITKKSALKILNGSGFMTRKTADNLENYFHTPAAFWLARQALYEQCFERRMS